MIEKETKYNILNTILSGLMYLWGLFLCFGGLVVLLDGELIAAILVSVGGLISLPFIRNYISSKMDMKRLSGTTASIISFILFIAMVIVLPVSDESVRIDNTVEVIPIPTSTPISTATVTPIKTNTELEIGITAIMERSEVTLLSAYLGKYTLWKGTTGTVYREYPESGNTFVILEVNIKSTDHETTYSKSNFYMVDRTNYRYEPVRYYGENDLKRSKLAIDQQTRGIIVFEIPEESRGVELIYEYGTPDSWMWHYETASWSIIGIERIN